MVLAMADAMIFMVDSDEAVGQCDDEDMRKLEALAANTDDEAETQDHEQLKNEGRNNAAAQKLMMDRIIQISNACFFQLACQLLKRPYLCMEPKL